MLGLYKPLARERGVVAQGLLAQLAAALTEQHVSLFLGQKKKIFRGPGARDKYLWLSLFFEGYLREASLPFAAFDPPVGHGNTIR